MDIDIKISNNSVDMQTIFLMRSAKCSRNIFVIKRKIINLISFKQQYAVAAAWNGTSLELSLQKLIRLAVL